MLTNKKKLRKFALIFFILLMTYRGWFQNCRMLFLQEYWLHQKPKARRKEKMIGCHNVIVLKHYLVSKNFILIKLLERGVNKVVYIFCYNNGLRNHSLHTFRSWTAHSVSVCQEKNVWANCFGSEERGEDSNYIL